MRLFSFHLPKTSASFLDYAWRNTLSIFAKIKLEVSTLLFTKCSITVGTSLSKTELKSIQFFLILNSSLVLIFVSEFLKRAATPKKHLSCQCVYLSHIAFQNFFLSRTFFALELVFLCKKNILGILLRVLLLAYGEMLYMFQTTQETQEPYLHAKISSIL